MLALVSAILVAVSSFVPLYAGHLGPDSTIDAQPGEPPQPPPQSGDEAAMLDSSPDVQLDATNFDHFVFLPLTRNDIDELTVNPQNKDESTLFYLVHYSPLDSAGAAHAGIESQRIVAETIDPQWTGKHSTCDAGDIAQEFRNATLLRINYFRAMAGVRANVKFSDEYNRKAQKAALMMSANNQLSHTPDSSWRCYSAAGAQAAGSSNLYLGVFGWGAISGYVQDPGAGNFFAGHRRWILYPQTEFMGSGDIPTTDGYRRANTLWVFDDHIWDSRPETREEFVAWPPSGYTPYQVVFPLWSFAYDDADFSDATVRMLSGGSSVSLTQHEPVNGYGENTLTWEPDISLDRPASDKQYTVEVRNVRINGSGRNFLYDVTIFDPDA